jgi:hypothetical protein
MMTKRKASLIVLALVGLLVLNYPWLSLFSTGGLFFGFPVLYLYLFLVWGAFIFLVGLLIETNEEPQERSSSVLPKRKHPPTEGC